MNRPEEIVVERKTEEEPANENQLRGKLEEEQLNPYRWSNSPNYRYTPHTHNYRKILYVIEGSITFMFPNRADFDAVTLTVGDRMELAPGISHGAKVGPEGVVCLEAHAEG